MVYIISIKLSFLIVQIQQKKNKQTNKKQKNHNKLANIQIKEQTKSRRVQRKDKTQSSRIPNFTFTLNYTLNIEI